MADKNEPVITDVKELSPKPDFFHMEGLEKGKVGYWAENNPIRIQQMKRMGYEVVPSSSLDEASKKREQQKEAMRRIANDDKAKKEDRQAAASILEHLNTAPIDTVTNIPEHIAMQTSSENYKKRLAAKHKAADYMKDEIQRRTDSLNKVLQRSGVGGGVKDLRRMVSEMVDQANRGRR